VCVDSVGNETIIEGRSDHRSPRQAGDSVGQEREDEAKDIS
jgi:hypothetical protein